MRKEEGQILKDKKSNFEIIVPKSPSWEQYCKDIGLEKRTVNRWLKRWFGEKEKENNEIERLKKLAEEYEADSEKVRLYNGDFYTICQNFENNSIDCIITDPPYPEEYLPLWSQLSEVACKKLKPGGFCITYSGKYHLPEVFVRLSTYLKYYWQLILLHTGQIKGVYPVKMNTTYKPILIFYKPPRMPQNDFISDVIKGSGRKKSLDQWQQSSEELNVIINNFTNPNDLVLDPFAGTGTTLIACLQNQRRCIGIEINEEKVKLIKGRIIEKERRNNYELLSRNVKN